MFDLLTDRGVAVDALGACQGLREPDRPPLRHGRMSPSWHDDAVDIYQKYRLVRNPCRKGMKCTYPLVGSKRAVLQN